MTTKQTLEKVVYEYEQAHRDSRANCRRWMAKQQPVPVTEDDFKALERRYFITHADEIDALEVLCSAVNVARAAHEERWIKAHEDLAVLRKAGILQ
jgi:hypothetical protein